MQTTLLFLAACLMFSGVHGGSESMSCSMVNGKTICNRQTSDGNAAMASSQAQFGPGVSYQNTYAGAGGPNQWDSSSQTVNGGYPVGNNNPSISNFDTQETPGTSGDSVGELASGYPDTGVATGGFGGPFGGVSSYTYSSSGSPNFFGGSQAVAGGFGGFGGFAGGFASAGSFPMSFPSGFGYPAQNTPRESGGDPAQGSSYSGPMPAPAANPFEFVNRFMGGGAPMAGAGAFAGGFFPFGR